MNLFKETLDILRLNGKSAEDVAWCGNRRVFFDWAHFASIANFEYDDGFGGQEIARDLLVVGSDFWLERHEYDGSEWWEFKSLPPRPEKERKMEGLRANDGWEDLEDINGSE